MSQASVLGGSKGGSDIGSLPSVSMKLVHYSDTLLGPLRSTRGQTRAKRSKPEGLWVSIDDCEDSWRAWCESENFDLHRLRYCHDVYLAESANVLVLSNSRAVLSFSRRYGESRYSDEIDAIRWDYVAELFDGLIIAPYQWSLRLDQRAFWYYSWDCASGCIWNSGAVREIRLREAADE